MKHKKLNKIFRYFILVSFVTFFALYLSQSTGYFEYRNSKKVALTSKQIEKFEKDVKEGKNIDLENYIDVNNKSYQNALSKAGLSISNATEKVIQKIIGGSFKILGDLVGEET